MNSELCWSAVLNAVLVLDIDIRANALVDGYA